MAGSACDIRNLKLVERQGCCGKFSTYIPLATMDTLDGISLPMVVPKDGLPWRHWHLEVAIFDAQWVGQWPMWGNRGSVVSINVCVCFFSSEFSYGRLNWLKVTPSNVGTCSTIYETITSMVIVWFLLGVYCIRFWGVYLPISEFSLRWRICADYCRL